MNTKENDKKGMKTAEHTMAGNKTKNREEFISDQPNDFDDRNLDKEGINQAKSKKDSE
ncbi:MAG: hypothetical protein R3213_01330 [Flavobacteriaceae bacterium]|nr:hypothetical protein [Flavobacteriaceae bacterium]